MQHSLFIGSLAVLLSISEARADAKKPADLTVEQLRAVMPHLTAERAAEFIGPLNKAMNQYDITTPRRRAISMSAKACTHQLEFAVATFSQERCRVAGTNPVLTSGFALRTSTGHHVRNGDLTPPVVCGSLVRTDVTEWAKNQSQEAEGI